MHHTQVIQPLLPSLTRPIASIVVDRPDIAAHARNVVLSQGGSTLSLIHQPCDATELWSVMVRQMLTFAARETVREIVDGFDLEPVATREAAEQEVLRLRDDLYEAAVMYAVSTNPPKDGPAAGAPTAVGSPLDRVLEDAALKFVGAVVRLHRGEW